MRATAKWVGLMATTSARAWTARCSAPWSSPGASTAWQVAQLVRSVGAKGRHSPQRVLGLFPDWYAPPQPDWPTQVRLTGFPLYDDRRDQELPKAAEDFLAGGDAPVVFTPGSAMRHGREFFAESAAACRLLGRRGLFVEPYAPHQVIGVMHLAGFNHTDMQTLIVDIREVLAVRRDRLVDHMILEGVAR